MATCGAWRRRARRVGPRRSVRLIQNAAPKQTAEAREQHTRDLAEEDLELRRLVLSAGPPDPHLGSEPAQGRGDQTLVDEPLPASQTALGDDRLTRARRPRPLAGLLDALAQNMDENLDHGRDGEPPTPQLARHERDSLHARADAKDREVLEDRPGRQIGHLLPMPPTMRACARAQTTPRTPQVRLSKKSVGRSATVFAERLEVGRKIESQ